MPPVPFRSDQATGSMQIGSSWLELDHNPFRVGDQLIVAVGGEEGKGKRGTLGVGGVYGKTTDDPNLYYVCEDAPMALVAKVLDVQGNRVELDCQAATSTTHARVYLDNLPIWNEFVAIYTDPDLWIMIPAGVFATSDELAVLQRARWVISGAGKDATEIMVPDGARSACLKLFQCPDCLVEELHIRGNARLNGYGLGRPENWLYPQGIHFVLSDRCEARNCRATDVFQKAVCAEMSTDVWAYDCEAVLTEGLACYIQWLYQWADGYGGGCVDCTVTSPVITAGFEAFRHQGFELIRPVGRNATISMNTAVGFTIDSPQVVIEENSQMSALSFSKGNPAININSNIGNSSGQGPDLSQGGQILNPHVRIAYINEAKELLTGISVNDQNPTLIIQGTPETSIIQLPDYDESLETVPAAIVTAGANTIVDGIRIPGRTAWWQGGVTSHEPVPTVIIKNSVLYAATALGGQPIPPEQYVNNVTPDEWVPAVEEKPTLPPEQIDALVAEVEATIRAFFH